MFIYRIIPSYQTKLVQKASGIIILLDLLNNQNGEDEMIYVCVFYKDIDEVDSVLFHFRLIFFRLFAALVFTFYFVPSFGLFQSIRWLCQLIILLDS